MIQKILYAEAGFLNNTVFGTRGWFLKNFSPKVATFKCLGFLNKVTSPKGFNFTAEAFKQ